MRRPKTEPLGGIAARVVITLGVVALCAPGQTPSKEYIRFGGRVIAVENLTTGSTAPASPVAASAFPPSSTATSQIFRLTATDVNGAQDIQRMYFAVSTSFSIPVNSCHGFYSRPDNGLYLFNDALTAVTGPIAPGSTGILENTQCRVIGSTTTVSSSGNTLELNIALERKPGYGGSKNLNFIVKDMGDLNSDWLLASAWNLAQGPPVAVSVTPANVTNAIQTFHMTGSDPEGYQDITRLYFVVNASATIPQYTCHGFYSRPDHSFYLYNDTLSTLLGPAGAGTATVLENSQCKLHGLGSTAAGSGNALGADIRLELKPSYWGATKNVYLIVQDAALADSGWYDYADWTVPVGGTPVAPVAISVTPANSQATIQDFVFTATDGNGYQNIQRMYFVVNTTATIPAGSCHGWYERPTNQLFLFNAAISAVLSPITAGAPQVLSNGVCSIHGLQTFATGSGNQLTLTARIERSSGSGSKNVYLITEDAAGLNSGTQWPSAANWSPAVANDPPALGPVTPSSGTIGLTTTFTATYTDSNGAMDIQNAHLYMNTTLTSPGADGCWILYEKSSGGIKLLNDAASLWLGPVIPGSGGSVQNSQCILLGAGSSISMSGNTLTLNARVTFLSPFAGSRQIHTYADDVAGAYADWVQKGTVTVPQGSQVSVVVSPSESTLYDGQEQTFAAAVIGSSNTSVTWSKNSSAGTLSAGGVYTAPTGIATVQAIEITAMSNADTSKSDKATVTLLPSPPPTNLTVSPVNGAGALQTFSFTVQHPLGLGGVDWIAVAFSATPGLVNGAPLGCLMRYDVATAKLTLFDPNVAWAYVDETSLGAGGTTIGHSHCQLNGANSSITANASQNTVTLNVSVQFLAPSTGVKDIYFTSGNETQVATWTHVGDWTVP